MAVCGAMTRLRRHIALRLRLWHLSLSDKASSKLLDFEELLVDMSNDSDELLNDCRALRAFIPQNDQCQ